MGIFATCPVCWDMNHISVSFPLCIYRRSDDCNQGSRVYWCSAPSKQTGHSLNSSSRNFFRDWRRKENVIIVVVGWCRWMDTRQGNWLYRYDTWYILVQRSKVPHAHTLFFYWDDDWFSIHHFRCELQAKLFSKWRSNFVEKKQKMPWFQIDSRSLLVLTLCRQRKSMEYMPSPPFRFHVDNTTCGLCYSTTCEWRLSPVRVRHQFLSLFTN
jgi:hypothetical protein